MKKYSMLAYHKEYDELLMKLGQLGVLHIQEKETGQDEETKELNRKIIRIEENINYLGEYKSERQPHQLPSFTGNIAGVLEEIETIKALLEDKGLKQSILQKEITAASPWGRFRKQALNELADSSLVVHFFICHEKHFQEKWKRQYTTEIISRQGDLIHFVVITSKEEQLNINAEEINPPKNTLDVLEEKQVALQKEMNEKKERLNILAWNTTDLLHEEFRKLEDKIQFWNAVINSEKACEDHLMILEGYVPRSKEPQLQKVLRNWNVHYLHRVASPDEIPPVLLRNNKFSQLFEPITNLFSLPSYRDMDLTPFLAPFFLLFFGFCLGDAVYGLIILVAATVFKQIKKYRQHKGIFSLLQFFGLATIVVGSITGTFFGFNHDGLDLGAYHSIFLDQQQLFNLSLVLGIVQIIFGLTLQAIHKISRFGFVYGLPQVGWILLILTLLDISIFQIIPDISDKVVYGAFGLIVLFADPKAGVIKGLGKGIWSLYGITGLFGDVLSYIRLFALGVSSSILGLVVNSMALQFLDISYIGWLLFGLIMILGHGLNLAIASLGAFVHPLRLTFVEFYKNAGFEGGGKEYKPFSIKHIKTEKL